MSRSIVRNQQQVFLRLWQSLRPQVGTDFNLPARIQAQLRRREFGARDRRLYRELIYTTLRFLPWIEELAVRSEEQTVHAIAWLAADMPATQEFRQALITDWPDLPPDMAARSNHLGVRGSLIPEWFRDQCPEAFLSPNLDVLHSRAPVWIRLQTETPDPVLAEFSERAWPWRKSDSRTDAYRMLGEPDLTTTAAYQQGRFEIQDLGSQLILASAPIARGSRWLDACAGAGGKTLQLAHDLGPEGRVDAFDARPAALDELRQRLRRGNFTNIQLLRHMPTTMDYDGVLVDAPCSGSGTWRRAPHLKWCTTPADISRHAIRQQELLTRAGGCVRPGGLLLYATCSLSARENDAVVRAFLAANSGFGAWAPTRRLGCIGTEYGLRILPACHDTDGFYVAALRRAR